MKKNGFIFIVLGLLMMLGTLPSFYIASQKDKEAEVISRTNEARAKVHHDSANFNRTIGFVLLAGGAAVVIAGVVTCASRRK